MFRRTFVWAAFAALLSFAPAASAAASKEIQELQRDVAQLQDQLKLLQQSQDRQLAELRVLVQQSLAASTDANKSVAVMQSGVQQKLRGQGAKGVTPAVCLRPPQGQAS